MGVERASYGHTKHDWQVVACDSYFLWYCRWCRYTEQVQYVYGPYQPTTYQAG